MKKEYIKPAIHQQAIETLMPLATSGQGAKGEQGSASAFGSGTTVDPNNPKITYQQLSKQNNGWGDCWDDSSDDSNSNW